MEMNGDESLDMNDTFWCESLTVANDRVEAVPCLRGDFAASITLIADRRILVESQGWV